MTLAFWNPPLVVMMILLAGAQAAADAESYSLLHGFGFAAALSEIGLPQRELMTGLLFFNVGVEIGQIVFAGAVIGLTRGLQRLSVDWLAGAHRMIVAQAVAGYAVGVLATFWLIERWLAFWPAE